MAAEPKIIASFEPIKSRLHLSLPDDRGFDTGLEPAELEVRVDHKLGAIELQVEAADVELVLSSGLGRGEVTPLRELALYVALVLVLAAVLIAFLLWSLAP